MGPRAEGRPQRASLGAASLPQCAQEPWWQRRHPASPPHTEVPHEAQRGGEAGISALRTHRVMGWGTRSQTLACLPPAQTLALQPEEGRGCCCWAGSQGPRPLAGVRGSGKGRI